MRGDVDQAGHHEKVRAVDDAVAFAGISLADEGDAVVRYHDVDAGSVDMRLGLVIPHDGEAAVSDERCRHSLILVVPPAASSAEPSRWVICRLRPRGQIPLYDVEN